MRYKQRHIIIRATPHDQNEYVVGDVCRVHSVRSDYSKEQTGGDNLTLESDTRRTRGRRQQPDEKPLLWRCHQCCSRVTMPRVRVQARVSSVRVRVKFKSFKKNQSPSRVHYSYESSPSRVPIDPHRVRVESESESSPSHSVLESKSSHESLNLAHESDSSPSPGLESYNTGCHWCVYNFLGQG